MAEKDAGEVPSATFLKRPAWLSGSLPQYLAATVVSLIAFSFGTCMAWSSVAVPVLKEAGYSDEGLSWATGTIFLGSILGACVFGVVTERYGRRLAALVVAIPLFVGWLGLLADWGLAVLVLARTLVGVGCGGVLVVCPMYIGEVVSDDLRGMLGSFVPLFLNGGILFTYVLGSQVSLSLLAVVCGTIPATFLLLFAWFPETPVFLLGRGRETAALESLSWLRDPRHVDVAVELRALKASQKRGEAEEEATPAGLRDLLATRGSRRAVLIIAGLMLLQQFSGVTAIISYATVIFDSAGSSLEPSAAACVVGGLQLVGSITATLLMDRAGRLPLLHASYGCMAVTLTTLGACFYWANAAPGWLPVLCLAVFIFTYALGSGPIPFVLISDVLPSRLRSIASQAALIVLFSLAFVVSKFFGQVSDALGPHGCFWMFGGFCVAALAFTKVLVPETKGRSVDSIVAELEGKRSPPDLELQQV